jgi:pyruvate/2-oxoglutarate dehydrogenase complex dihydrolipoamide dehydrogenase (E3) component
MPEKLDALIIGTGQSGPALAGRLTAAGWRVAIVERKLFGGTCVNTGCIPTKTLVASARAAHVARRAGELGVVLDGPVRVDMGRVKARKDGIVKLSSDGVEGWLRGMERCTVYTGHARFEGPDRVRVGDELIQAPKIFINVGGRASLPSFSGVDTVPYLTNSTMMEVDFLPEHLVIVGGSYIGLELGQMYRRFGSAVTIIERQPRLVGREDEDVSAAIRGILEDEGITVRTGADCIGFEARNGGIVARASCAGGPEEITGSHLLVAAGRRPNTDDLGLEKAGIETDEHGYIKVDGKLATNVPGIWAMGDCNGRGAFTHTSYNDFEIVAANLLDDDPRDLADRITAYNLYIDPPLGRAGLTEAQARSSGRKVLMAKRSMERVGRAVERGETKGFMKILVDADTRMILGATLLGIGGDEIIHSLLDIMYAKAPYTVIQRAMHIHPTVSELIPTMLGDLEPLG